MTLQIDGYGAIQDPILASHFVNTSFRVAYNCRETGACLGLKNGDCHIKKLRFVKEQSYFDFSDPWKSLICLFAKVDSLLHTAYDLFLGNVTGNCRLEGAESGCEEVLYSICSE